MGAGIRYFRDQFLPGHKVLGAKFCPGIRILAIFDKISDSGTLKFMKNYPVIGFLGTFLPGH